jgi:hypothetical protein
MIVRVISILILVWKLKHQNLINNHWNLDCLLWILLIRRGYISYYFLNNLNFETIMNK